MRKSAFKCLVCHHRFPPEQLAYRRPGGWWEIVCGVCGTKLRMIQGDNPQPEAEGRQA